MNAEIIATLERGICSVAIDAGRVLDHARSVRESMDVYLTDSLLVDAKNAGRR